MTGLTNEEETGSLGTGFFQERTRGTPEGTGLLSVLTVVETMRVQIL